MILETLLAAGNRPYGLTCQVIGNCSANTPNVAVALTNAVSAIIALIGGLAVVFIIINGLQMTLSVGNPKRYQQARDGLFYSVVGLAIAVTAFAIVSFVSGVFG